LGGGGWEFSLLGDTLWKGTPPVPLYGLVKERKKKKKQEEIGLYFSPRSDRGVVLRGLWGVGPKEKSSLMKEILRGRRPGKPGRRTLHKPGKQRYCFNKVKSGKPRKPFCGVGLFYPVEKPPWEKQKTRERRRWTRAPTLKNLPGRSEEEGRGFLLGPKITLPRTKINPLPLLGGGSMHGWVMGRRGCPG